MTGASEGNPITPALTSPQKEYLLTLWKSYHRPLVHVPLTMEKTQTSVEDLIPKHAYDFIVRLHAFSYALLQQQPSSDPSPALRPFRKYATKARDERVSGLPRSGRRVLHLHQEDFLQELNAYEMPRRATDEEEFIRNQSYGAYLYHRPEEALAALSCALPLSIITLLLEQPPRPTTTDASNIDEPGAVDPALLRAYCQTTQVIVRFLYVQPILPMNDVRTGLVGKFLSLRGHVIKVRPQRLAVATAEFACRHCSSQQTHSFYSNSSSSSNATTEPGQYSVPSKCSSPTCKSKSFLLLRSTARYMDGQEIRLQEIVEDNVQHIAAGRTPRQIDVTLQQADLVDRCRPGDAICVAAVVAARRNGGRATKETIYQLYLQGHSITTMSESRSNRSNGDSAQSRHTKTAVYTTQQLRRIVQLCHADHLYFGMTERRAFPFDLLVRSICPAIIGHHTVKVGLLLCLLGGTPTEESTTSAGNTAKGSAIRSNSHLLIVGDPGMGKSQLLLAATQLAARSVYVGGNTSSTTGLTVTLTKEPVTGETSIEAGALVLADQGICAIDEFDKMTKNHQDGLLEAMEQQQVSIAKAGVVASLPARCSVIAAANPKQGNYNMGQTVAENINMAKPILSRFDLVFILRDHVDQNLDRMVSSTIMNLYRTKNASNEPLSKDYDHQATSSVNHPSSSNHQMPLLERLLWVNEFQKEPLPADLVRDYISYAREYCKPKLTSEAAAVLKDYFMELRYPSDGRRRADTVPITTRQLEALIRLCQARAKACLRDYVLQEDALDVVELMTSSVEQVHATNEMGAVDPSRGGAGGQSNRKMKKALVNEIQRIIGVGAECSLDDLVRLWGLYSRRFIDFQF